MTLISVEDAQERLLSSAAPIDARETVTLSDADGRVLAEPVIARLTQPPFNASAMDGYALRAADAPEPGAMLTVIGTSAAGHAFDGSVGPGEAVRIFTGAPVPTGADSVLLQEDAEKLEDGRIRTTYPVTLGRHIRPKGQDFAEGETVIEAGLPLDFGRLMLAAASNTPTLSVYRRPRVAILATGDELVAPGTTPGPSQIIASNTFAIASLCRAAGAEVIDLGIVGDRPELLEAAIDDARRLAPDVLVTLGGASVGDHDIVQKTLTGRGMRLDFWRIAMRPGKPLMVGRLDAIHVLGLPGNPISSMVCALLFLEPLLHRLGHRPAPNRYVMAETGAPLAANDHRQDFLRATLSRDAEGRRIATAYGKQDSSMMKLFSRSDCLIVRKPHDDARDVGAPCEILLLRDVDDIRRGM